MTRGILIAGNESSLAGAIETEAARRVEHFAAALFPNRLSGVEPPSRPQSRRLNVTGTVSAAADMQASEGTARFPLQWNPASPVSTRTLIFSAEHRIGHINEAILVCDPPSVQQSAVELQPADIEIMVNDCIKGWFFLARELLTLFRLRGAGSLALVYPDIGSGKNESADIFRSCGIAVFRSLTRSLLDSAQAPCLTMGFSGVEDGDEAGFAAFVLKHLEEANTRSNGKLHHYGKRNFFK